MELFKAFQRKQEGVNDKKKIGMAQLFAEYGETGKEEYGRASGRPYRHGGALMSVYVQRSMPLLQFCRKEERTRIPEKTENDSLFSGAGSPAGASCLRQLERDMAAYQQRIVQLERQRAEGGDICLAALQERIASLQASLYDMGHAYRLQMEYYRDGK